MKYPAFKKSQKILSSSKSEQESVCRLLWSIKRNWKSVFTSSAFVVCVGVCVPFFASVFHAPLTPQQQPGFLEQARPPDISLHNQITTSYVELPFYISTTEHNKYQEH